MAASVPAPLVGAGQGGGSRRPLIRGKWRQVFEVRRDPPPQSSPTRGEEAALRGSGTPAASRERCVHPVELCWGRWPDRAGWGAAGRAAAIGVRSDSHASRVGGQRNGGPTALSSVFAQVHPGPAPQHDASGDDALAGLAQSSARWPRLSPANSDRTVFRRLRLPSAQAHRRSRRPHARVASTRRSETPSETHGFVARDFACCDFRTI